MLQHTYSVPEEHEVVHSWGGCEDVLMSEEDVEGLDCGGIDGETFGYFLGFGGGEEEVICLENFEA